MDIPSANPKGYNESDITLQAEALRGKRFLLLHGSSDDNVHFQNAMQLVRQLQLLNINFECQVENTLFQLFSNAIILHMMLLVYVFSSYTLLCCFTYKNFRSVD